MRPKGSAATLEQRRRQAIALLEQGMNGVQVAQAVGTSPASVCRWREAYRKGGATALAGKPPPGKPPGLTARQLERLARLLLGGARKQGYNTELWTLKRMAEMIQRHFGVQYHHCSVWHVLRAMHWSNQKPKRFARERDEQAIAAWQKEHWPRIKKRPKKRTKRRISG
jgi:transposase